MFGLPDLIIGRRYDMTRQEEIREIIKEVNEYRQKDKLSFFVGAGVSKMSNCPTWAELVLSMADEIGYDSYNVNKDGKPMLSSEEFLKIPQMYYNSKGESVYLEKVRSQLNVKRKPNKVHKLIMKMNPYHLLTTNYDDLLEQSANLYGINYSVVNSDKKVAGTATQRYILKVHGDFEENNFVLKESDYLNYELNFKLIDAVMKTIMATHMIVFIGYQLGDYNIKLILNWVQNVQGDSFIKPVFIYTDPEELKDIDIDYYKQRGLRIICAYDLCPDGEFEDRYKSVLNNMLNYVDKPIDDSVEATIDYLHEKLKPLDSIQYLRAKDFINLFDKQSVDDINIIHVGNGIFERFYVAYDEKKKLSPEYQEKAEYIMKRIHQSGIIGCYTKEKIYTDMSGLRIQNNVFYGKFQDIEDNISLYGDTVEELYNKAYDLCMLGRLEESYQLYIDLLDRCKEEKKWFYYFFIQINLKFLNQIIKIINTYINGIQGLMHFGKPLAMFEPEFVEDLGLYQAFTDLPAEIKKYAFLNRLSTNNYYADDIVDLYEKNYKIRQDASKSSVVIFGAAAYDSSEILMMDAINFIYNNKLIFSLFSEHSKFVRTTMHTYLLGKSARMKIEPDDKYYIREEKFELDCQDIILIANSFGMKELPVFVNEVELKEFCVTDEERRKFEEYLISIIHFYNKYFNGDIINDKINMYLLIKDKINSLCYVAPIFIENVKVIEKFINFVINVMPEREFSYSQKLRVLELIKQKTSEVDSTIIKEVEDMLVRRVIYYFDNPKQSNDWWEMIRYYPLWIAEKYPGFKSKRLFELCKNGEDSIEKKKVKEELAPIIIEEKNE